MVEPSQFSESIEFIGLFPMDKEAALTYLKLIDLLKTQGIESESYSRGRELEGDIRVLIDRAVSDVEIEAALREYF